MSKVKTAVEIIGIVERGDLNADLTRQISDTLQQLQDMAPTKGKIKGSVKLTLNFIVEGRTVAIEAGIETKVPKRQRGSSFYFLTPDGGISTEHPQQQEMFAGPRELKTA